MIKFVLEWLGHEAADQVAERLNRFTFRAAPYAAVLWCGWVSHEIVATKMQVIQLRADFSQHTNRVGGNPVAESMRKGKKKMKSLKVALINRYPGGRVHSSEHHIEAFDGSGRLRVSVVKDGNGDWKDVSAENGALDKLDLSPIPKETRAMKLAADGKIVRSEEHEERIVNAHAVASRFNGRVPSEKELKAYEEKAKAEAKAAEKPQG